MNWLRDNIVKILIIMGVAVVVIVVMAIIFKPKKDTTVSGSKYGELETKLQNAAIKYISQHKKLLPTTTEGATKVELKTLQSNNFIGNIVAVDDSNVKCEGYVEITKASEDENLYRYTPYIACGEYYVTKTIGDYIIDKETEDGTLERTTDSGLYKIGEEYFFRGEKVNNFIIIGSHKYRIIRIEKDKTLKLISTSITKGSYSWDDRYNVDKKSNVGINNFMKSRIHDVLVGLGEPTDEDTAYFSKSELNYIIEHDFCIGKRPINDANPYSNVECAEKTPLKIGMLTPGEAAIASLDPNCKTIYDASCVNYNYFFPNGKQKSYSTITAVADNTYQFYRIKTSGVNKVSVSSQTSFYPVVYINPKTIFSSGTGTTTDPYIVR